MDTQVFGFNPDPELVKQLKAAISGKDIFYATAYNDGPDIGMRLYSGNEQNPVGDVRLGQDRINWLISADVFLFEGTNFRRLKSCSDVDNAPIEELALTVRAQGLVNGKIENFSLGLFLVSKRTVTGNHNLGRLTIR